MKLAKRFVTFAKPFMKLTHIYETLSISPGCLDLSTYPGTVER